MGKKGKTAQTGKPKKLTPKEIGKRLDALVKKLEEEVKSRVPICSHRVLRWRIVRSVAYPYRASQRGLFISLVVGKASAEAVSGRLRSLLKRKMKGTLRKRRTRRVLFVESQCHLMMKSICFDLKQEVHVTTWHVSFLVRHTSMARMDFRKIH